MKATCWMGKATSRFVTCRIQQILNQRDAMVITHRLTLAEAAHGYEMFLNKADHCEKVVLST